MNDLEQRVAVIEARNKRVEKDKAWETSGARKAAIAVLTYIVVVLFFFAIRNDRPFINAAVPVMGFLLSALALGAIRKLWESKEGL